MAFTPLQPATINITHSKGAQQAYKSEVVRDFAGAAVNLSAFTNLVFKLIPQSPSPTQAEVTTGTVAGGADGILTVTIATADLASALLGTANCKIIGRTTGADPDQLLASGSFQLVEG